MKKKEEVITTKHFFFLKKENKLLLPHSPVQILMPIFSENGRAVFHFLICLLGP